MERYITRIPKPGPRDGISSKGCGLGRERCRRQADGSASVLYIDADAGKAGYRILRTEARRSNLMNRPAASDRISGPFT
jgi:hypothetical protein